jgi:hypothetical protein
MVVDIHGTGASEFGVGPNCLADNENISEILQPMVLINLLATAGPYYLLGIME